MEDDGSPERRLDAIETVLGLMLMHMPGEASRIMLSDLSRLADVTARIRTFRGR